MYAFLDCCCGSRKIGQIGRRGAGNRIRQQSITVLYWIIEERVNQDAKKYVKTDTSSKDMFAGVKRAVAYFTGLWQSVQ